MEEYQIDMPALTGRIDRLLAEQKLSAARMARDLGFSSGLYSQWKKGSGTPSAAKLLAVAQYLRWTKSRWKRCWITSASPPNGRKRSSPASPPPSRRRWTEKGERPAFGRREG